MQLKLKKLLVMLPVMLSLVAIMTAIMTLANLAPSQPFLKVWMSSFIFALLVILPIGAGIFATLTKLINQFCGTWSGLSKNLLQGVLMALIMEAIMAVITTLNNHQYGSVSQFYHHFFNSLLYALPVGLCFSCFMALVVKPKLEQHFTKISV